MENRYYYVVTYKNYSGVSSQKFDDLEKAFEFFWSIHYKAYSIWKIDKDTLKYEFVKTGVKV